MRERSKSCCWEVTCRLGRGGQARGRSPVRGPGPPTHLRLRLCRGLEPPPPFTRRRALCKGPYCKQAAAMATLLRPGQEQLVALCQVTAHRLDKQEVPKEVP